MPEISRDDVAHLAGLARIQLSEDELDRLGRELPQILESVATVSQALEGRDDVTPMSHPTPLTNVFREDVVRPSLTPEEALLGMTVNAARALGLASQVGAIAPGKAADLAVWNVESPAELAYWIGLPGPERRIYAGVDA